MSAEQHYHDPETGERGIVVEGVRVATSQKVSKPPTFADWYQEAYLTRDGGPGGVICLWVNVRPTLLNGTLDDVPECWVHDGTMPENAVAIEITEDALDYDKLTEALQEGEMIDLRHGTKETE